MKALPLMTVFAALVLQGCACGCQAPEQHARDSPREHCLEMTGSRQEACLAALPPHEKTAPVH